MPTRFEIVAAARLWLGTPYRHQQSLLGVGCDCLGLVRGVWRALYGQEPAPPPPYSRSWAEETGREMLAEAARKYLVEYDARPYRFDTPVPDGDVLLFRIVERGPAKHAGITVAPNSVIHAYEPHPVSESRLVWRKRIAYAFRFPEVID